MKRITLLLALSLITLLTLSLAGCTAATPPVNRYLLRFDSTTTPPQAAVQIGLGQIAVAPYLSETAGVVIEVETGQVRAANQHLWAEPLDAGLRSYLRATISEALGSNISATRIGARPGAYTVDVYVDQLHGTMKGTALLDAVYRISRAGQSGNITEVRFSRSRGLAEKGYVGVVNAEAELIRELATSIAESLDQFAIRSGS